MTTRPNGHELEVPRAELVRVVARILARCTRQPNGCLLFPLAVQDGIQIRARLADGSLTLLSAPRAVLAAYARPAPLDRIVMHTCADARCLSPSHLEARPRRHLLPAARTWNDKHAARLRKLVEVRGMAIETAARTMRMPESTAQAILTGRRLGDREAFGTVKEPRCSRCGKLGHYRNRGCPLAGEERTAR